MALQFFFGHILRHFFVAIQAPTIAPAPPRVATRASRRRHRESSAHDSTDAPASKRQRIETRGSLATSLPYYGPCFRSGDEKYPTFIEKLESPVLKIYVGPGRNLFKVHQAMLTEAAEYFRNMFISEFKEALEGSASFPEDDTEAWELLVEWCYQGHLPPLQTPATGVTLTAEMAHSCTVRVKLCCLAEKYGMSLLQNLAMDSIIAFLKNCGPEFGLEWDLLKQWFHYAYTHTHESSGLRRFMAYYFWYMLTSSTNGKHPNRAPYSVNKMHSLAEEIPDFSKDFFIAVQDGTRVLEKEKERLAPWQINVCYFHNHLDEVELNCPGSLALQHLKNGENGRMSSTLYTLLSETLEGVGLCNVAEVARELGRDSWKLIQEIDAWVHSGVMVWVDDEITFKLAPYKDPEVKKESDKQLAVNRKRGRGGRATR